MTAAVTADEQRLIERSTSANRSTLGHWAHYRHHRHAVTQLILGCLSAEASSVCVLGAGNCNDVDLPLLSARAGAVDLVDIDEGAVQSGMARQSVRDGHVAVHVANLARGFFPRRAFDVVASTGILTQLIDADRRTPVQVRRAHLRVMTAALQIGGRGLLVSDLVSSTTMAGLANSTHAALPTMMVDAIVEGNFFSGTNPYAVCADLAASRAVGDIVLQPPWIWTMGEQTVRLAYAVTFRRCR